MVRLRARGSGCVEQQENTADTQRRCWRQGLHIGLALAVMLLFSRGVSAQSAESDKAAADALFDAARTLMEQKRYAEACPKLADSHALDPGIGTLLNLGLCYALNGQTASAWTTYREAAAAARAEGQAEREKLARAEATRLEPKLTRVVINVSPEAQAAGVSVKRDGKELPQSMWGIAFPIDPGEHTMEASAPGKVMRVAKFAAQGEGATIQVSVPPLSDAAPEVAAPAPEAPPASAPSNAPREAVDPAAPAQPVDTAPRDPTGTTQRVLAYVAGGVGVAGLVAGGLIMRKGNSQNEQAKQICAGSETDCPDDDIRAHAELTQGASNNFTRSYIAYGVGGALLTTGVVLLVTAPTTSEAGRGTSLNVGFGPSGFGLQWHGRF